MYKKNLEVGRFAPSPTGYLHFGSLLTAIASYCHVKQKGGKWLIRIEDTDTQRCKAVFSESIVRTLASFSLHSDSDVIYQSQRKHIYAEALQQLISHKKAYACHCSRKSIHSYLAQYPQQHAHIYPMLCRGLFLQETPEQSFHIRQKTHNKPYVFEDHFQGQQVLNPYSTLGDMVLKRKEGVYNYIFTSVIDDAAQGVTEVIRGLDLLHLTPCQILLHQDLALQGVLPHYGHLPLANNAQGQKLSKQNKAVALTVCSEQEAAEYIQRALQALQQPKVDFDTPDMMLQQAVSQWCTSTLTHQKSVQGIFS